MIENETMKQFSRMKELDKVYRVLFRTLSNIRCDGNIFAEIVNSWKSLTIFVKRSIIDNWQGPTCVSGILGFLIFSSCKSSAVSCTNIFGIYNPFWDNQLPQIFLFKYWNKTDCLLFYIWFSPEFIIVIINVTVIIINITRFG